MFGMTERAGRARLVHEALDHGRVGREIRVQDLDRDPALDQRVLGEEHRAHPACSQRLDDPIPPLDHVPRFDHHFPRPHAPMMIIVSNGTPARQGQKYLNLPVVFGRRCMREADDNKRDSPFPSLEKLRDQLPARPAPAKSRSRAEGPCPRGRPLRAQASRRQRSHRGREARARSRPSSRRGARSSSKHSAAAAPSRTTRSCCKAICGTRCPTCSRKGVAKVTS